MALGASSLNIRSVNTSHGFFLDCSKPEGSVGLNLGLLESQHQQRPSTLQGQVHLEEDLRQGTHSESSMAWMAESPMHFLPEPRQLTQDRGSGGCAEGWRGAAKRRANERMVETVDAGMVDLRLYCCEQSILFKCSFREADRGVEFIHHKRFIRRCRFATALMTISLLVLVVRRGRGDKIQD